MKRKITAYLSDETEIALTEIYLARYRNDRSIDKSKIVCEAILLLYNLEFSEFNDKDKSNDLPRRN